MNTKVKLISTISVFCMVLALLVTGVWSVSTANITLGGTISFKADNVHATVTGTITGTQETITLPDLEYKADTDTTSTAFQSNVEKWSNNKLTFTSENLITMTITVTNLSTERSLYVIVTDNTTTSNINKTFTNTANVESGKEYQLIAEGSITYTMTMKVDKLDLSAEATYAYDVDLRDANAEPVFEHETLKYDSENDYYYVEMGTYDSQSVRWKLVGIDGQHYDGATPPTSGEGTFILETKTTSHIFGDYYYDDNMSENYANTDYATSAVRQYLTGTDCALTHNGQDMEVTGNYLNDIQITESDSIYSRIKAREISDLYKNIKWNGDTTISDGATSVTGSDKLWIPSVAEMYSLVGGGDISTISETWDSSIKDNLKWDSTYYWSRSAHEGVSHWVFVIDGDGTCYGDSSEYGKVIRPAFILEF